MGKQMRMIAVSQVYVATITYKLSYVSVLREKYLTHEYILKKPRYDNQKSI